MDSIKWADVAHYYSASGISIERTPYEIDQFVTGKVSINEGAHVAHRIYVGGRCVFGYEDNDNADGIVTADKYKPILRHRNDMTEAEIREMFFTTVTGSESPHDWKYRIFGTKEYNPNEFHYLISKGFDMFGLIESGQAIRKEVDNG